MFREIILKMFMHIVLLYIEYHYITNIIIEKHFE